MQTRPERMERITSRTNLIVKRFRAAADGSPDTILLDGAHLLNEALASGVVVRIVAVHERLGDSAGTQLVERAARHGARTVIVGDRVLAALSPVRQPSGLVAIADRPRPTLDAALQEDPQFILILAGVQDPGNVGAIIRSADACGATGVVTLEGTADPFGWKALRGAMGSAFRIPVAARLPLSKVTETVRARGIRMLAAVPRGGTPLPRCDLRVPAAVLLGGEGAGLARPLVSACDATLTIPMARRVESLNVATAAAIVAYEAMRQRQEAVT